MAPPTAIVTGGSSGIGLALVKHLVGKGWSVAIADLQPPKESVESDVVKFFQTDVTSWDDQARLFGGVYEWQGRLDYCALNAGLDDRDDIFHTIASPTASGALPPPPVKPDMTTFNVNLLAVYYGLKLAAHYFSLPSTSAGKSKPGGKITITASVAGLYPLSHVIPQYIAAKAGVIAMTRCLVNATKPVNISVNTVCPGQVMTGLTPPEMLRSGPGKTTTPMATMMRCFEELVEFDRVGSPGWVTDGKFGQVVEARLEELVYHSPVLPDVELMTVEEGANWAKYYVERNTRFTRLNDEKY